MRAPIRKELIARFTRELQSRFPEFILDLTKRDMRIWALKLAPKLTLFVVLQAFESYDRFALEVAWNEDGSFPWGGFGRMEVDKREGRERLGFLWGTGPKEPLWDLAPEQTAAIQDDLERLRQGKPQLYPKDPPIEQVLPRVAAAVDDAIQKLLEYGIPLLRRVAEHRGIVWPSTG